MENVNPAGTAEKPRFIARRWRRWVLYLLAAIGAVCLAIIGVAVVTMPQQAAPTGIAADEAIDQLMSEVYGAYSNEEKAWMHAAENGGRYAMRVVHRAKIVDAAGKEELYFMVSGHAGHGKYGAITGAFKLMPDPAKKDGSLMWASNADLELTDHAIEPNDVRFEALNQGTFGWVVKPRVSYEGGEAGEIVEETWNVVLAPNGDKIVEVARFISAKQTNIPMGCPKAQARYADWKEAQAQHVANVAMSADDEDAGAEPAGVEHSFNPDSAPLRCSDAKFSYRTSAVPEDGFVTFTVTGGGLMAGERWPDRTWRMVFDAKGFVYHVPAELRYLTL